MCMPMTNIQMNIACMQILISNYAVEIYKRMPITRCNPILLEDCKIEDKFSNWKMDPSIDFSRQD